MDVHEVSRTWSISRWTVALRASAAARARSDSRMRPWTAWYQRRCCDRLEEERREPENRGPEFRATTTTTLELNGAPDSCGGRLRLRRLLQLR
ncbi:hypothetical protein CRUP_003130 [Coryphaenoides rupestris]|nr:hypothetical protein CRUP_003130 [Coryphaenoides rupestris]